MRKIPREKNLSKQAILFQKFLKKNWNLKGMALTLVQTEIMSSSLRLTDLKRLRFHRTFSISLLFHIYVYFSIVQQSLKIFPAVVNGNYPVLGFTLMTTAIVTVVIIHARLSQARKALVEMLLARKIKTIFTLRIEVKERNI